MSTVARRPYSRRPPPGQYDNGFLANEFANIQGAFLPLGARLVRASTTVDVTDDVILCDCTAGPISVTLLDPSRVQWDVVTIKKIDASANQVTIVGTVDGLVNPTSHAIWNVVTIMSDGSSWFVRSVGADIGTSPGSTVTGSRMTADVSTSGGAFVTCGLTQAVAIGESWSLRWTIFVSSAQTGGIQFQVMSPSNSAAQVSAFGTRSGAVIQQGVAGASPLILPLAFSNAAGVSSVTIVASFDTFAGTGTVDLQFKNASAGQTQTIKQASSLVPTRTN